MAAPDSSSRINLSLTSRYAPSWKAWEGLRELVQNWHDGLLETLTKLAPAGGSSSRGTPEVSYAYHSSADGSLVVEATAGSKRLGCLRYSAEDESLTLVNRGIALSRKVLLLGYSSKARHRDVIGMFGEGMKVGSLALLREGYEVTMVTKADAWSFQLAFDPTFDEKVLTVFVSPRSALSDGLAAPGAVGAATAATEAASSGLTPADTATVVNGVSPDTWRELVPRFLFLVPPAPPEIVKTSQGSLLLAPRHKGQLFVKGIWISNLSGSDGSACVLKTGVDFFHLDLDRDRRAVVRTSDLDHQVSTMWIKAVERRPDLAQRYYQMLSSLRESADVRHASFYASPEALRAVASMFHRSEGATALPMPMDAAPSRIRDVQTKLDRNVVLCSPALYAMLQKAGIVEDDLALLAQKAAFMITQVPMSSLGDAEADALAHACRLVAMIVSGVTAEDIKGMVDVMTFADSTMCQASERRLQVARHLLNSTWVHAHFGSCDPSSDVSARSAARPSSASGAGAGAGVGSGAAGGHQGGGADLLGLGSMMPPTPVPLARSSSLDRALRSSPIWSAGGGGADGGGGGSTGASGTAGQAGDCLCAAVQTCLHALPVLRGLLTGTHLAPTETLRARLLSLVASQACGRARAFCMDVHQVAATSAPSGGSESAGQVAALKAREAALCKQIDDLRKSHASRARDLKSTVEGLRKEVQALNKEVSAAEVARVNADMAVHRPCEAELRRVTAEFERRLAAATSRVRREEDGGIAASQDLAVANRRIATLEEELTRMRKGAERRDGVRRRAIAQARQALIKRTEQMYLLSSSHTVGADAPAAEVAAATEKLAAAALEVREELERLSDANLCCVCMDAPVKVVLLPCRHQHLCTVCARAVVRCPMCRVRIERRIEVFA